MSVRQQHFKELFQYLHEISLSEETLNVGNDKKMFNERNIIDQQLFQLVREMQKNKGKGIAGYSSMKSGFLFSTVCHNTVTLKNLFDWLNKNLQWNDVNVNISLIVLMFEKKIIEIIKPSYFASRETLQKELLIVIGGGFAGLTTLKSLTDRYSVILIDKKNYFELIPAIPFLIQNVEKKVTINYSELVKKYNFTFIQGSVKKVTENEIYLEKNFVVLNEIPYLFATEANDSKSLQHEISIDLQEEGDNNANNSSQKLQQKEVITTNEEKILSFDYLLISTGAGLNLYNHPLFNSDTNDKITFVNGYDGKSIKDSLPICDTTDNPICVIGGGLVAAEVAGELIEKYSNKKKKIILIQRSDKLLSHYDENVHEVIYDYFKEKGMEIMLNTIIESVNGNELKLFDKEKQERFTIRTDICFICFGSSPQTNCLKENMSHCLDENNFIIVNNQFRVKSNEDNNYYSNIFAVGDVTNTKEDKVAKIAYQHAVSVIKILQHVIYCKALNLNDELSPFEYKEKTEPLPRVLSYGNRGMIIKEGHHFISGGFLIYLKEFYNVMGILVILYW
ncbi:hypothetical protein ABK040_003241 [Willaertia magna]